MADEFTQVVKLEVPVKYRIISGADRTKKSKYMYGLLLTLAKNELRMNVPAVETDGLHISFGDPTFIRNTLEIEIDMPNVYWRLRILGEVEWYELIPHGIEYRFCVGISFKEISDEDRKKLYGFLNIE